MGGPRVLKREVHVVRCTLPIYSNTDFSSDRKKLEASLIYQGPWAPLFSLRSEQKQV